MELADLAELCDALSSLVPELPWLVCRMYVVMVSLPPSCREVHGSASFIFVLSYAYPRPSEYFESFPGVYVNFCRFIIACRALNCFVGED